MLSAEAELPCRRGLALHRNDLAEGRDSSLHIRRDVLQRGSLDSVFDEVAGEHGMGSKGQLTLERGVRVCAVVSQNRRISNGRGRGSRMPGPDSVPRRAA